jgi:polygalacturonase
MPAVSIFNVCHFGAIGDGLALDSPAINAAIEAATQADGGTVLLPAGTYLSFTLHLRSHVELHFAANAILLAATPSTDLGSYDPPEPNKWGDELQYQDFGHSHWRNSLIVGENLTDIAITGPGLIDGRGLLRHATYATADGDPVPNGTVASGTPVIRSSGHGDTVADTVGHGNKAIALRNCQRVILRDFSLHRGGHFALLATGVDDLTITGLTLDTNREGLDIDGCRRVHISHCVVNSPMDDAIVLKTSYALGELRSCEDILIEHCTVSGYDVGTVLDGSYGTTLTHAPDRDGPTGRIKIGTESNGDFRNITIRHCTFRRSRGLALETVDGATIENVSVSHLTLEDITNSAIFLRIGNRARGPVGTPIGALRNVTISDLTARQVDGRFPIVLSGLPDHPLENILLANITVETTGGITLAEVAAQADHLVNAFFLRSDEPGVTGPRGTTAADVPERPNAYPEPSMFGLLPASALFARHVRGLTLFQVRLTNSAPDERPPVVLDDVTDCRVIGGNLPLQVQGIL